MLEMTDEEIKGRILHKLSRWRKFGASYTDRRDSVKGLPPHFIGLKLVEEMIKDNLLIAHKGGKCVSINLDQRKEVERLINLFLEKKYTKLLR
jgi:hypothetical protein